MGLAVDTAQWQCYIQNNNFQLKVVFLFHSFMGLLIMKRSIEKNVTTLHVKLFQRSASRLHWNIFSHILSSHSNS